MMTRLVIALEGRAHGRCQQGWKACRCCGSRALGYRNLLVFAAARVGLMIFREARKRGEQRRSKSFAIGGHLACERGGTGLATVAKHVIASRQPLGLGHRCSRNQKYHQATSVRGTLDEVYMQGVCFGTIAGIKFLANTVTESSANSICVPSMTTSCQSVSAVVRYLRSHPEMLNDQFAFLGKDALRDAWPCKRQ